MCVEIFNISHRSQQREVYDICEIFNSLLEALYFLV
jgi:hypothetical protein